MDFMKVIDQTVREIKREVNLKVLKVPEIEQKVLDATDNEPWGPHGTALAEIAQATKKFSECQLVMNVLWTRLGETGKDWRYVYKALAVIEYLVSHGSERAVDDIIEHTFQISSLSSFEYVEPSGKDMGINVRKKAENIVALLNNKDKIQEVRTKAAANREKYFGLSSSGITYKTGSDSSYGSGGFQSSDRYGGFKEDSYKERDRYGEELFEKDTYGNSRRGDASENQESTLKRKGSLRKGQDNISSNTSKSTTKSNDSNNYSSIPLQRSSVPSNNDDDDFDPRGLSSNKPAAGSSKQVDLFGDSLIGDLMDAPTSAPAETSAMNGNSMEVDLFADADFVSAKPQPETGASSEAKTEVDLFASQPAMSSPVPPPVDFFATSEPVVQPPAKPSNPEPTYINIVDPFAAVPLNNFDGSDVFGAFTSNSNSVPTEATQNTTSDSSLNNSGVKSSSAAATQTKKEAFQVKSGIWADSLSRGIIDLNISAPKKVSLVDVGIVGGLSDGADEMAKGPPTSFHMGRAMGTGSGLGRSGFTSSQATVEDDLFSNLGSQQYQFGGSFKK
ncbi:clathrin interactor EPSIN 1 isoform X2 [Mangifera indica]|uniref:clathrin interactor EPSIN 1 isoform X2 n=1 Tax=Mangifera indica TaxID=29780 RepID=UPI001CFB6F13|nr:clathrin interactor EPSIN 1 isoform X2 [Mangifera indica]